MLGKVERQGNYESRTRRCGLDELERRVEEALEVLRDCHLCPRRCGVNRLGGERGTHCHSGRSAVVSSCGPHFGEERCISGIGGSGTVFFANCGLGCLFCQNYQISHLGEGREASADDLAEMMLGLQRLGCHNLNLVTPTHFVPQILEALLIARFGGLDLPLVYNTSGYETAETLSLLDGVIDIYMPDFKYADQEVAERLAKAPDYPDTARTAIRQMHRQGGDLVLDACGVAQRGLLLRHLVLPGKLSGYPDVFEFMAREISVDTYVNIMDQYRPCHRAHEFPSLDRRLATEEYLEALQTAARLGLRRLDGAGE